MSLDRLNTIASGTDQKAKTDKYRAFLNEALEKQDVSSLNALVDHLVSESTPLVVSRLVLQEFTTKVASLSSELQKEVASYAISKIQSRVVAFEEQVSTLRENLSSIYEDEGEWIEAAKLLVGIPLDSGQRVLTKEYKAGKFVKIAQLYLEEEEFYEADRYLNKASAIIMQCDDQDLIIVYKASLARVYEHKRKFFEAAARYYELSKILLDKENRDHALESAVVCTMLSPAGPQRSIQLASLYKDERSSSLTLYPVLQKMFMSRIISKKDIDSFVCFLKARGTNLAVMEDGTTTVLDKAIREHNLLSASKLYVNIRFEELGNLLNISEEQAETLAATMIGEKRLQGYIDQIEKVIYFQNMNPLKQWDHYIEVTCSTVNRIVDEISSKYPDFAHSTNLSK